jgi:ABC-2 type transport system ATP-binding protein
MRRPRKRIDALIEKFDLRELADRPVYSLSTGQQVRASLAKAFLNQPKLLLLDEPTASLDPSVADRVRKIITQVVKEEGTTVFLTSHNMAEVEEVCTRVLFLNEGKIQAEGTPQELARRITRWAITLRLKNQEEKHVEMDRSEVGPYLTSIVKAGNDIDILSIHEPTLEDFFVHFAW